MTSASVSHERSGTFIEPRTFSPTPAAHDDSVSGQVVPVVDQSFAGGGVFADEEIVVHGWERTKGGQSR